MTYNLKHPETKEMYRLRLEQDRDAQNPRDWDNAGKMVCFHKRYLLPNEGEYNRDHFDSWDELGTQLKKDGAKVILPIYMYDHSGLSVKTTPFQCRWGSGQIGFIYLDIKTILENWSWKWLSPVQRETLKESLRSEVETFSQYISGDVWGFIFEKHSPGIIVDDTLGDFEENDSWEDENSCWGFYGTDLEKNGILDHLPDWAQEQIKAQR